MNGFSKMLPSKVEQQMERNYDLVVLQNIANELGSVENSILQKNLICLLDRIKERKGYLVTSMRGLENRNFNEVLKNIVEKDGLLEFSFQEKLKLGEKSEMKEDKILNEKLFDGDYPRRDNSFNTIVVQS
ncbi:MAG: hypothetical protein VX225_00600, partial [Pseudomonadota bacterium]|nr:hypothetical protein [Pseudomonadota bacterium]